MISQLDLPLIWAGIIAFGIIMYVVMDGFDLGIGILFPFFPSRDDRSRMMNSIAPVWDGNETWLVLGGAGMFGAFPLAYAVILSALYLPLSLMLIALIFRGVAFEFRFKAGPRAQAIWETAFAAGSIFATFTQGIALGAFIQGFKVAGRAYAGGPFDWLTPFSLFTGAALVAGYALLGCGWLIMKTAGVMQYRLYQLMPQIAVAVVACIAAVSIWSPFLNPVFAARWFSWPNIAYLSPVPILVALLTLALLRAIQRRAEAAPFLLALGLFILSYAGLGISLWPNIIPPQISIWQAAAPPESQGFLLIGFAILIPVILAYTAYNYWVFRGKVAHEGYH